MLNAVIYFFISGLSYYTGCSGLLAGAFLSFFRKKEILRHVSGILLVTGMLLIMFSSVPMSPFLFTMTALAVIILLMSGQFDTPAVRGFFNILRIVIVAAAAWAAKDEMKREKMPDLSGYRFEKIFVIGDSLSGGVGFKGEKTWVEIAAERSGAKFIPLCVGGATVGSSLERAELVTGNNVLVILELGGNDILKKTDLREFRKDLTAILKTLSSVNGRTIMMFEMPSPPLHKGYNMVQRELADKFYVKVIPPGFFAKILTSKDMTTDGIHLSNLGHEKTAELILSILDNNENPVPKKARKETEERRDQVRQSPDSYLK